MTNRTPTPHSDAGLPAPACYATPVALIPLAVLAFIFGNLLMMIPWSAF